MLHSKNSLVKGPEVRPLSAQSFSHLAFFRSGRQHLRAMSMLNPKVIPSILYHAVSNGVETAILCNSTGAVLSSHGQLQDEAFVSAVIASVWQNCQPPSGSRAKELDMCLLDSMSSRVAVGSCGSYLVFLIAQRDVEFGLLSLKLKAIRDCLSPSFEQLDAALAADDVQQKAGACAAPPYHALQHSISPIYFSSEISNLACACNIFS